MAGVPLERTSDPGGDPASIKLTWLRQNNLSFQRATINASRVNADPAGQ